MAGKKGNTNARKNKYVPQGMSRHPLYSTYVGMIYRCFNPKSVGYEYYGGAGITICERWLSDVGDKDCQGFLNFIQDIGEKPPGTSLDRYPDPYGNYEPGNVRWATPMQQGENTRTLYQELRNARNQNRLDRWPSTGMEEGKNKATGLTTEEILNGRKCPTG